MTISTAILVSSVTRSVGLSRAAQEASAAEVAIRFPSDRSGIASRNGYAVHQSSGPTL
ncbi:hypothetical protein [Brucella sp. 22210]|uniref:hypothetical protein n=1 Tax=Brucella sp. 22210 TaxID=3453892 RepID=UPI003F875A69